MATKPKAEEEVLGAFFSRVYLRPATSLSDSARFRRRLHAWIQNNLSRGECARFSRTVRQELGAPIPESEWASQFNDFFLNGELRDVLDTISVLDAVLADYRFAGAEIKHREWRTFVARAFNEEGLGYVVDSRGGVRYSVDEEYERNRFSVINGLGAPRYAAVKQAVENAFSRLDAREDTKAAVRDMFEAAEILAKLMTGLNEDLDERMVQRRLKPIAQRLYDKNKAAGPFADQMLEGFAKWVSAGHKYRHGHATEEPLAPPIDLAVAYVSNGAAYIRLLADLDGMQNMLS